MVLPARKRIKVALDLATVKRKAESLAIDRSDETSALIQAFSVAPHLVSTESNPSTFLFHYQDEERATRAMASYWETRLSIFGEKAFEPIHNLLGPQERKLIDTGVYEIVTGPSHVYFHFRHDKIESDKRESRLSRIKVFFYMLTQVVALPQSRVNMIQLIRTGVSTHVDSNRIRTLSRIMQNAMPFDFRLHVCALLQKGAHKIAKKTFSLMAPELDELNISFHVATDAQELKATLNKHGLQLDILSKLLSCFSAETQKMNSSPPAEAALLKSSPTVDPGTQYVHEATIARRKERKRQMDLLYARERRKREKANETALHSECRRLRDSNMKLQEDNKILESTLTQALIEVRKYENSLVAPSQVIPATPTQPNSGAQLEALFASLNGQHPLQQAQPPPTTMGATVGNLNPLAMLQSLLLAPLSTTNQDPFPARLDSHQLQSLLAIIMASNPQH